LQPINTPVCSPQSNDMAESFVNTFKRDYVARMDLRDAQTVMARLPAAFEHFNEVHPHSSLKMRSPQEFRRQQDAPVRQEPSMDQALYCD
jgi:transposase InsO family protein